MTDRTANRSLRRAMWWSFGLRVSGALVLALCAAAGIRVGSSARLAAELAMAVPVVFLVTRLVTAYRGYRRDGLGQQAAFYAVAVDLVSLPVLKLMIHEFSLFTGTLRWLTGRWRHGVRGGDMAIPYASGGAALLLVFACVSAVETVVLAVVILWPVAGEIALALDLWGVYFIIALFASFIRIPARETPLPASERSSARGTLAAVDANGCTALSQGGQTTVTVQLARPVAFTRPRGKPACARTVRFYAPPPQPPSPQSEPASPPCRPRRDDEQETRIMNSQTTSPAANAELVRAACRAFNAHDADECLARIAPDFIINLAELPEPMHGKEAWRQNFETMKHAFPDFHAHLDDILAAQDKVAVRLRIRGTHSGEFLGIPATGRAIDYVSHEFYRVAGGLIAEEWICSDMATLLRQLS